MDAREALRLAEGELQGETVSAGERALVEKTVFAPAALGPHDLAGVVTEYGRAGAIEIVSMVGAFHFINRIADLVGIQSDLPVVQPRWARLRRAGVRMQGWLMGELLDLANRPVAADVDAALERTAGVLGALPAGYDGLREAPNVAAYLTTIADVVEQIDAELIARIAPVVADALPTCEDDATGLHPRPADPIDALAFVGTRYVVRTTAAIVDIAIITNDSGSSDHADDGGLAHGRLLIELVDAVLDRDQGDSAAARRRLEEAAGADAVVDAGAVLAMFELNDRVADATGAPLEELALDIRLKVGERLGMTAPS